MNTDPSFSFDLHPELDAELDAAFERNVAGGADAENVANNGLAGAIARTGFNMDPLSNANVPKEFREELSASHEMAKELFDKEPWVIQLPGINDPEFINVNWESLAKGYTVMERLGLEPEIIFSPQNPGPTYWKALYSHFPAMSDEYSLYIDPLVKEEWAEIAGQKSKYWSVSVIAASAKAPITNVSHDLTAGDGESLQKVIDIFTNKLGLTDTALEVERTRAHYPNIDEYLALQALRLADGNNPIDQTTTTWLVDTFTPMGQAANIYWRKASGSVRFDMYDVTNSVSDSMGVRPVVRS